MLIIRADGNAKIGAGHLMRCLTIAGAAKQDVLFLCADVASAELAESHGFRAEVLHTDYRQPETEFAADGKSVWDRWIKGADNTILVDSYYVTDGYLEELKRYGRVFLLDDLQDHAFPVDGVINYNVFAEESVYRKLYKDQETRCYLGGAYMPLRQQFCGVAYEIRDAVKDVLITTGGGDADNIAGAILDGIYDPGIHFHVLVGRFSPHFESWRVRQQKTENIEVYFDVQDMAGLLSRCDLALSAGGSTVYEIAAIGVPLICFSYAKNQEALVDYIKEMEIAGSAGAWHRDREACLTQIRSLFGKLCSDRELRRQFWEKERTLIDGRGAKRLAEILAG